MPISRRRCRRRPISGLALVRRLKRKVPFDKLCLAGGVALNCVTNEIVRKSGEFSDVFIPSAPHDAGTAIGAAYTVHCVKTKKPPERGKSSPYLGPAFSGAKFWPRSSRPVLRRGEANPRRAMRLR